MNTIHLYLIPANADILKHVQAARGMVTLDPASGSGKALDAFSAQSWRDVTATDDTKKVDAASVAWSRLRGMAARACEDANVRAAFDAARGEKVEGQVIRHPDAYAATMLRELGKHARAAVKAGRPVGFRMVDGTTVMIGASVPNVEQVAATINGPKKATRSRVATSYIKALQATNPVPRQIAA